MLHIKDKALKLFYDNLDLVADKSIVEGIVLDESREGIENAEHLQEAVETLIRPKEEQFVMTMDKMKELVEDRGYDISSLRPSSLKTHQKRYGSNSKEAYYASRAETYNFVFKNFDILKYDDLVKEIIEGSGIEIAKRELTSMSINIRGDKGFNLNRSFKTNYLLGGKEIHHDLFTLPDDKQKRGISKRFFRELFKLYEKSGVVRVSLQANKDVGGYCWGKYGFMATKESAIAAIDAQFRNGIMSKDQFDKCLSIINSFKGDVCMSEICGLKGADEFMKGADWDGYIELKNQEQMARLYEYLGLW